MQGMNSIKSSSGYNDQCHQYIPIPTSTVISILITIIMTVIMMMMMTIAAAKHVPQIPISRE